jgi:uncharacterized protein
VAKLPDSVITALDNLTTPVIFATADNLGLPNVIYCTPCMRAGDETLLLADNYFVKTRANAQSGSQGSILFLTPEWKAYQVKGTLEYLTGGPLFDQMRATVDAKHPRVAAVVLHVGEVY